MNELKNVRYKHCVSLGWFCGCASALSKLGLRSTSGPFDWYFSSYKSVLSIIENNFYDFMVADNLELSLEHAKTFIDKKYGFHCNHDIQESFESEIEMICGKYKKRAERFIRFIKEPTLFVRVVRDEEEVEYINENYLYADNLVKRYNSENDIIYVARKGLDLLCKNVKCFTLDVDAYIGKTFEMRHLFDNSEILVDYLLNSVSDECRKDNLVFDRKTNKQKATAAYINKYCEENHDGIDGILLQAFNINKHDGIYIWGAGKYGKMLVQYLINRGMNIIGIIDNAISYESYVSGVSVNSFDSGKDYERIFIAVANEKANMDISQQICGSKYNNIKILRYSDLNIEDI